MTLRCTKLAPAGAGCGVGATFINVFECGTTFPPFVRVSERSEDRPVLGIEATKFGIEESSDIEESNEDAGSRFLRPL